MPRRAEPDIYVVKNTFWVNLDGTATCVRKGEHVRRGHELLRSHRDMFEPVDAIVHYDVEQATAAPGEKRGDR